MAVVTESANAAPLSFDREALVDVSASIATRREGSLSRALRVAARAASPHAVDEVLLQAHLFVGFPIALEALILWRRIHPEHVPVGAGESDELWAPRGETVCRTIYAGNYEKLRINVERLHPDFDQWMATGGYGRVIGRPRLDLATRELCIVALLAVWNAPRQLHSHLRGALHAGASSAEAWAAIGIATRHLARPQRDEVVGLATRVLGVDGNANGDSA
jgi:4-carboxymuconolactone decarboxylase